MGRKRRKIIRRQPKPFPSLFLCPVCNTQAVSVTHVGGYTATVKCRSCGTEHEVPWYKSFMPVDAYSIYYDIATGRRSAEDVRREIEERAAQVARALEVTEAAEEEGVVEEGAAEEEAGPSEPPGPATAQSDTEQET